MGIFLVNCKNTNKKPKRNRLSNGGQHGEKINIFIRLL